jgi:hypothetical protein
MFCLILFSSGHQIIWEKDNQVIISGQILWLHFRFSLNLSSK